MEFFMRLFLLLAVLSRAIGSSFGGLSRYQLSTKLERSPVGIGIKNAIISNRRRVSSNRRRQFSKIIKSCRQQDEDYARNAKIMHQDVQALGAVRLPLLRDARPSLPYQQGDELDWLEGDATLCKQNLDSSRLEFSEKSGDLTTLPAAGDSGVSRGGGVAVRPLVFWENMVCGAVSRSIAQTVMHPANTMKTILQSSRGVDRPTLSQLMRPDQFRMLTRGAGANFLLSVPHGAVNFAVLEFVRGRLNQAVASIPFLQERLESIGPALDFTSSAISTICCSVVSTPQMMITDNIMAGNYPNLPAATSGLYKNGGIIGFYRGWFPGLVGKIPSYALTWTFFQQIKRVRAQMSDQPVKNIENTIMGCMASAASVTIMIPMDTIKTRLVTQMSATTILGSPYKGIIDCAVRVAKEEGVRTFYRGLPPRLISVVPMIGIQFGVYEAMKKAMLHRRLPAGPTTRQRKSEIVDRYGPEQSLEEAAMEVAASSAQPLPAPHFLKNIRPKTGRGLGLKKKSTVDSR